MTVGLNLSGSADVADHRKIAELFEGFLEAIDETSFAGSGSFWGENPQGGAFSVIYTKSPDEGQGTITSNAKPEDTEQDAGDEGESAEVIDGGPSELEDQPEQSPATGNPAGGESEPVSAGASTEQPKTY